MTKREKAFRNQAMLDKKEVIKNNCDCCSEDIVFEMKDNHHNFTIPLSTILQCLKLAEEKGGVPKLPDEWWKFMHGRYPYLLDRYILNKNKGV